MKQFDFRRMTFYQIWIRSFADGNGDGIGDLYGVYEKLPYIKSLGVDGIWFSPIFPSPNADYGYDISDYRNIHPDYGTLEQFRKVLSRAHELGLKVLLDLVVNHTSDEHPWFIESCRDPDGPYGDYYIWRDPRWVERHRGPIGILKDYFRGKDAVSGCKKESAGDGNAAFGSGDSASAIRDIPADDSDKTADGKKSAAERRPPNNWYSQFEGLAWEYNDERRQYFLHVFAKKQPDLNMDNPRVREEVKSIMRFWLDMGVDGFREDVITFISKDPALPNGIPFLPAINGLPYYKDGPNLLTYLREFRAVAKEYGAVQIGEAPFTGVRTALVYLAGKQRVLDMMIQFDTMTADCIMTEYVHLPFSLRKLKHAFSKWQDGLAGHGAWNALYLENHDHPRVISRYGSLDHWRKSGKMLAACYLFQRGTPFIYQGQEIGMTNIELDSIDKYNDVASIHAYHTFFKNEPVKKRLHRIHISSRDSARTPVQWTDGEYAGFSTVEPWFYVNPNYKTINAASEADDPDSILNFYRKCLALRKSSETLIRGIYREYYPRSGNLYMYERQYRGERILVICSFSGRNVRYRLPRRYASGEYGQPALLLSNSHEPQSGLLTPYETQVWRFRRN